MGVDISLVVRHRFYELDDHEKSKQYCEDTIEKLRQSNLHLNNIDLIIDWDAGMIPEYQINLNDLETQIILRRGYWEVETYYRYFQYFVPKGEREWLRQMFYDITLALGEKHAWVCAEYHLWNCAGFDVDDGTFEEWYEYAHKEGIGEMGKEEIPFTDNGFACGKGIYHDDFSTLIPVDLSTHYRSSAEHAES